MKYLLDSNILIEFVGRLLPGATYNSVSEIIDKDFNISFITKVELLGHSSADKAWQDFIDQALVIMPDDELMDQIIQIRKNYKIKIPDAFIAATALTHDLVLLTRNLEDFKKIKDLKAENPWSWNL